MRLRPYQQDAVDRVRAEIRRGNRRVLLVAPTGSGKTVIASHIIASAVGAGSRVLFMAHRRELIGQAYRRLLELGLAEAQLGVLMANDPRRRPAAAVQVASIDTLRNRANPQADLVFVDEAHRALAKSYRDVAALYPSAVHLGLTATPYRADGRGLDEAYDGIVVVASISELIREGFLVEPRVFTVPRAALPELDGVRVRGGDYDEAALADAVDRKPLVGNIVEHWLSHARGVRTVAFAVSVAHSKHIAERFREAGVAAEHLDGTTPLAERDAILARLESGETLVVSNCGVLCEGWDQPAVKCAILARPTKSTGLYLQQAGRILRPSDGSRAIILDHGGCAQEHGLPQEDRVFSLDGKEKDGAQKSLGPPVKTCPQCHAVVALACRRCPECGAELATRSDVPEETAGALEEVTPETLDRERREWDRLCAVAAARGFKPGWAFFRFRENFGKAPPESFPQPLSKRLPDGPDEKRAFYDTLRAGGESAAWARIKYRIELGEPAPAKWE